MFPGFEPDRAGLYGLDPSIDLGVPRGLAIGVRRAVEAGEEFCGEFGAGCGIQAKCIRQDGLGALGHTPILRRGSLIDKRPATQVVVKFEMTLGVLLCEMASGTKPFDAATIPELFSSILRDSPGDLPHAVPVEMRAVIARCPEKEPGRRYQHVGEVVAALDAIQAGTIVPWFAWRYQLSRRRWLASATALLGVAALLAGFDVGGVRQRLMGNRPEPPIKLAVLPFEYLTGDPEQEYFSDGLTEEMITQLGRLHPRLSVIARTSSMRYKNRATPIDQIGRDLGVDYVLEGSARREGARVRIHATLVQVRDQTQRRSDSFDRELAGILSLQSDVARGVAGSLALTLLPAEQARLANARSVNPEAYEAYLKAAVHVWKLTAQEIDTAQKYFELALQKDPNYALAQLGIGMV